MKRALGIIITILLAIIIVSSGLAQVPTHKLVVKTGDWVEFEVKQVWGSVEAYGRTLKAGDKLKYKLVGTTTEEMRKPDGTLIAYAERPLCDVWLNGEQVATEAEPEPEGFTPFMPASDAYWQDAKELFDSTKEYLRNQGLTIKEYRFDIGGDAVNVVLDAEMAVAGATVKMVVKWVIDRDTGVVRSVYFYTKAAYGGTPVEQGYSMEMTDTNVAGARPAFAGGMGTWIIVIVVVVVVVVVVGVFFYLRKRRAVAAPPMAPPPPAPAPGAPPAPGTTG